MKGKADFGVIARPHPALSPGRGFFTWHSFSSFVHPSDQSSDEFFQSRWERFSLSPGERAGVKVGVTPFIRVIWFATVLRLVFDNATRQASRRAVPVQALLAADFAGADGFSQAGQTGGVMSLGAVSYTHLTLPTIYSV